MNSSSSMLFRQLFDVDTSTYTYLLADEASRRASIIDPVLEQVERDSTLILELELDLVWVLDTHVHADHVTGAGLLAQRFGARTVLSERAGSVSADRLVKHGDGSELGQQELVVRETPGHTLGCVSYVGAGRVFTGDALLVRGCGRTDFQQGDAATLYRSVHEQLFSLPGTTLSARATTTKVAP
jgi:glyoxylase-like metal-dependent hydrolase (beta-lactamase superfamily II)